MHILELEHRDYDNEYTNGTSNVESAFRQIPKNSTAFLVWRIENSTVVPVPREHYGTLYDEECYIIYAASVSGQPIRAEIISREVKLKKLDIHVHFWLGAETTPDKSGVAAYKTVELDSYLPVRPTQHREVQGCESARFRSYFRNALWILRGKHPSVLSINSLYPSLFKVQGKHNPVLIQMPSISWDYFNSGQVYILQTKSVIFIWLGRGAQTVVKTFATKIALQMKDEEQSQKIVYVDDGYEKTLNDSVKRILNNHLDLTNRIVQPATAGVDLVTNGHSIQPDIKLYKCSDMDGKYKVMEFKAGPLSQEYLDCNEVFMIDHYGGTGIWIWVGKNVNDKERSEAMRNGRGFVKKKKYESSTPVTRVIDGMEPSEFKNLFTKWRTKQIVEKGYTQVKVAIPKFDATTMRQRHIVAAEAQLLDDGSGVLTKWRVMNKGLVAISKPRNEYFFSGDCYVITYTYSELSNQKYVIYYWLGKNSSKDDRKTALNKTIEKDAELGEKGIYVRIIEGHEPTHFFQIFKGKMIVFQGKGTDYDPHGVNNRKPNSFLLQVTGSLSYNTSATQVPLTSTSLNSNHCFILQRNLTYIWCGAFSTGDQREMAKGFVAGTDFTLVMEAKEKPDFWETIGGKKQYNTEKTVDEKGDSLPARLFNSSLVNGILEVEEIVNFQQSDLSSSDVMLLDACDVIYLWFGQFNQFDDKKAGWKLARKYLKKDPRGRDIDTPIIKVRQFYEPPTFTGFFGEWDDKLWNGQKPYEIVRQELEGSIPYLNGSSTKLIIKADNGFDSYHKYPITILTGSKENLPSNVNPLRKELHLTHDDFVYLFKMGFVDFEQLPRWKQQNLKKQVGLF